VLAVVAVGTPDRNPDVLAVPWRSQHEGGRPVVGDAGLELPRRNPDRLARVGRDSPLGRLEDDEQFFPVRVGVEAGDPLAGVDAVVVDGRFVRVRPVAQPPALGGSTDSTTTRSMPTAGVASQINPGARRGRGPVPGRG